MIDKLVATSSVAAGGLLKRSFQTADDVSAAKRLKASNVAPGAAQMAIQGMQPLASAHMGLFGQKLLQGQLQGHSLPAWR